MSAEHPPSDCGFDVAAYVLGALEPDELAAFRRHLQRCSVCQADIDTLTHTVNALALSAPQYSASPELRRWVMARVREDAKARRRFSAGAEAPLRVPRYGAGAGYKPGLISAGAMLALVLVLAVVAVFATGSSHSPRTTAGGQVYEASVGSGEVIVRDGHAELIVHRLAPLSSRQTYEVWLQHGSAAPQPTGTLFNVSGNGDGDVDVPDSLSGVTKMLVTQEPAGGTAVPTSAPVIATRLS